MMEFSYYIIAIALIAAASFGVALLSSVLLGCVFKGAIACGMFGTGTIIGIPLVNAYWLLDVFADFSSLKAQHVPFLWAVCWVFVTVAFPFIVFGDDGVMAND